jgi:hypothetical protein
MLVYESVYVSHIFRTSESLTLDPILREGLFFSDGGGFELAAVHLVKAQEGEFVIAEG